MSVKGKLDMILFVTYIYYNIHFEANSKSCIPHMR